MGGGTMFRGVARLAGAAAIGGAAAVPTTAHCHVRQPALRQPDSLSDMSNLSQTEFFDANTSHKELQQSFVDLRFDEEDNRECCVVEKREETRDIAMRQLIFSPPPTEEEVEEATKELQSVLHLSIPAPAVAAHESLNIDMSPKALDMTGRAHHSQSSNHLQALATESSSVMKAFQLLQTNPKVQDVVKSLASDPAVWNAVLSNEKVQELTQDDPHELNEFFGDDDENVSPEDGCDDMLESMEWDENLLSETLYGLVSTTKDYYNYYYSYVKGKLFSIMDSMFGTAEKKITSKESKSAKDKTVASCIMLAVAVLIMVVLRRTMTRYPRH